MVARDGVVVFIVPGRRSMAYKPGQQRLTVKVGRRENTEGWLPPDHVNRSAAGRGLPVSLHGTIHAWPFLSYFEESGGSELEFECVTEQVLRVPNSRYGSLQGMAPDAGRSAQADEVQLPRDEAAGRRCDAPLPSGRLPTLPVLLPEHQAVCSSAAHGLNTLSSCVAHDRSNYSFCKTAGLPNFMICLRPPGIHMISSKHKLLRLRSVLCADKMFEGVAPLQDTILWWPLARTMVGMFTTDPVAVLRSMGQVRLCATQQR